MKTDMQLRSDVLAELAWDPAVHAPGVDVTVQDGIVSINGSVDGYMQTKSIERAMRRVAGVRGIALDLDVQLPREQAPTDAQLETAALHALRWHSLVPEQEVKVTVEDGRITLSGEVDWAYQAASAEQCLHPLVGVKDVANRITIRQRADPQGIRHDIADALARHAQREARHIAVEVDGSVVTLRGQVNSMAEHEAALGTAYAGKGVTRVVDRLEVVD